MNLNRHVSSWVAGLLLVTFCVALPEEGKWDYNLRMHSNSLILRKNMFKGGQVYIKLNCESSDPMIPPPNITISWVIVHSAPCDNDAVNKIRHMLTSKSLEKVYRCQDHIVLDELSHPLHIVMDDGLYFLGFQVDGDGFNLDVHVEMNSAYGYLSAVDWPLLPFYAYMCIFYVILGLLWAIMLFHRRRNLLGVQYWIGGVILLGILENASFYAEYQSINNTGLIVQGAIFFAECVSCVKRTLTRVLVVIVSLGIGIIKPHYGAVLYKLVSVGMLYFFLALFEAYFRVSCQDEQDGCLLVASVSSVLLAVLDLTICLWIFKALFDTSRTLRLHRNEIKLNIYKNIGITLIFYVAASGIFILIIKLRFLSCFLVWKDLWLLAAYWQILSCTVLLIMMVQWQKTNNNQRYAFDPELENGKDEEHLTSITPNYSVSVEDDPKLLISTKPTCQLINKFDSTTFPTVHLPQSTSPHSQSLQQIGS